MEDASNIDRIIQQVRLELYRDNLDGALRIVEAAHAAFPCGQYDRQALQIRAWLSHLRTRETYAIAYERYYRNIKRRFGLKLLERELRTLTGRRTRKMVDRCARHPEFERLEREVVALGASRVLDAGCGEGRVALTLGARHPRIQVEGIEVSLTNVRIAQRLNRFSNVAFHLGLVEDARHRFRPGSFDLAYSFSVLEHVSDVEETVATVLDLLRPGGRFCISVPMNALEAVAPLPEFAPEAQACHVRAFTEADLRQRFARFGDFSMVKIPGKWRPGRYPDGIVAREFGVYFVAFSKS